MTQPWGKFFWSDYAGDPALKLCSLAAQGLWMRMLCIAAEHDPVGYVAINGEPLSDEELAVTCGARLEDVEKHIAELERRGVFSRDRRGWIYSRRMKNDAKRREVAAFNGKKGGNPKLRKREENSGEDKRTLNGADKAEPKPHIPEARVQSNSVANATGANGAGNDPASPEFDPVKALFDDGIRVLCRNGTSEKSARSMIGRWRREHGDDAVALGLAAAERRNIEHPVEWLQKWFARRADQRSTYGGSGKDIVESILAEAERHDTS